MAERKLLVADDNANIRKVVKLGFEALGYRVSTAADGKEALELVRRERPDVVILDVMMPEKSGYDVCSEMKNDPELKSVPVVMLTAKSLEEDKYWGRALGADEYLTKPFDPEVLERTVERILDLRERGESYHPLTRLPLWAGIRNEIEQRRDRGEPHIVMGCSFEPVAFETYEMKYGNIKAEQVVLAASRAIVAAVESVTGGAGFVGHTGDNVFHLVLPPGAVREVRDAAQRAFDAEVRSHYSAEDASCGFVRKPGPGGEGVCIPLLSLDWKVVLQE